MAKGKWEPGDVCYLKVKNPEREYIGVVTEVNAEGVPRVLFHHCAHNMWLDHLIYIKETLPIWLGRIPGGVDWNV